MTPFRKLRHRNKRMTTVRKRVIDLGTLVLSLALIAVLMGLEREAGGTTLGLAATAALWIIVSVPVGVLVGHCALGEDRTEPKSKERWSG
jgi:hypothetical protein